MNSEMIGLDLDSAVVMVRSILSSDPGREFKSLDNCTYFYTDNCPNCVVGHVLSRVGIKAKEVIPFNTQRFNATPMAHRFDSKTEAFLTSVQGSQDCGIPWGELLDDLEEIASDVSERFE